MSENRYAITVRLRVGRKDGDSATVFGRGTAELLRGVEATGSLNQAAKSIGMAYSKAWTGIKNTEEQLGFPLIERRAQHGSVLTEKGRAFLLVYEQAESAAAEAASRIFAGKQF